MTYKESAQEIVDILSNLQPNKVITLSDEAGKLLLETVATLKENGDI